jgi:hypothetical protein
LRFGIFATRPQGSKEADCRDISAYLTAEDAQGGRGMQFAAPLPIRIDRINPLIGKFDDLERYI